MSDRVLEQLFERFRVHGDVEALGQVFDAIAPGLRRVARHLTNDAAEADDLVQATFLAAIEKRASFDASREIRAWLTGILLKHASLARRSRARVIERDRLEAREVQDPADTAAARELSEALTAALAQLSPGDRDVLIPLLLDGRRAVEIARELGRRPDTVHMRIHRGLERLRRLLPAGLASIALAGVGRARGLGAVRAEVLRHAHAEMGGAGVIAAGAAAGVVMSTKKLAVAAALAAVLVLGGWRIATSAGLLDPAAEPTSAVATLADAPIEAPRAANDRAPATASAAAKAANDARGANRRELAITIRRADGTPASDALVALAVEGQRVRSARAGGDGRCVLPPSDVAGRLFVRDASAFPHALDVEANAEHIAVDLPRGVEVSGRLVMEEGTLPARAHLRLWSDSVPSVLEGAGLAVYRALDMFDFDDADLVAHARAGVDGSFRFVVPDERWSGTLRLPSGLVFVEAGRRTESAERHYDEPAANQTLHVAFAPRVIGRIVDAADGQPVADARFQCDMDFDQGGMGTGDETDADGRFLMALHKDLRKLQVHHVRAADGREGSVARIMEWSEHSEVFDAGDLVCVFPATRRIEFRVRDAQGNPIAGARARMDAVESVRADEFGFGVFRAAPSFEGEMCVAAPGYAIALVPFRADTDFPVDVVLMRANRLTIELPPGTRCIDHLAVDLVVGRSHFGGRLLFDRELRRDMVGEYVSSAVGQGENTRVVRFAFDPTGRIELDGIVPGVPFRVQLQGWKFRPTKGAMDEIAIDSLGVEEQRRIVLVPDREQAAQLYTIRGRARDERGRALHRAEVVMKRGGSEIGKAWTGVDGTFRIDLPASEGGELQIAKRGYVPFRAPRWDANEDLEIDAVLRRGRDLRLEIVDAQDNAQGGAEIFADVAGFGAPWLIERAGRGVHVLCDLPPGVVDIEIQLGGNTYEHTHSGMDDVARVVLPGHGRVEVSWRIPESPEDEPNRDYKVALRPLQPECEPSSLQARGGPGRDRGVFEDIRPGEYMLGLEIAEDVQDVRRYVPLTPARRVTIRAGETVRVEL